MLDELRQVARRASSERALRKLLADCRRLLSERGEANSVAIAASLVAAARRRCRTSSAAGFFDRLARDFSPDPRGGAGGAQAYAARPDAQTQMPADARWPSRRGRSCSAASTARPAAPRRSCGCAARCSAGCAASQQLRAVEADLFAPAVELVQPRLPADAQGRLEFAGATAREDDPPRGGARDRRLGRPAPPPASPTAGCFAFFHPQLPDEPLIFVEVALLPEMPAAIAPLIDKSAKPLPLDQSKVAAFYSISNCEPGLRGVSLGNFLIKRVAEHLKRELPQIKTFCTCRRSRGSRPGWRASPTSTRCPASKRGAAADARQPRATRCSGRRRRSRRAEQRAPGCDKLGEDGEAALLRAVQRLPDRTSRPRPMAIRWRASTSTTARASSG